LEVHIGGPVWRFILEVHFGGRFWRSILEVHRQYTVEYQGLGCPAQPTDKKTRSPIRFAYASARRAPVLCSADTTTRDPTAGTRTAARACAVENNCVGLGQVPFGSYNNNGIRFVPSPSPAQPARAPSPKSPHVGDPGATPVTCRSLCKSCWRGS